MVCARKQLKALVIRCLCALAFLTPSLSDACLAVLAKAAYLSDHVREWRIEPWLAYKNGPNPSPKRVDLSHASSEPYLELADTPEAIQYGFQPTQYDRQVLELRQGDTVVFDGKSYRLGKFLGAGNASHVYELADDPKQVIRVPFLAAFVVVQSWAYGGPIPYGRFLIRMSEQSLDHSRQAVRISERDPQHRYLITSRVNGSENGLAFIRTLLPNFTVGLDPDLATIYGWRSGAQREKVNKLIAAMEVNRDLLRWDFTGVSDADGVISPYPLQWSGDWAAARQYLWDGKDWIKVDG